MTARGLDPGWLLLAYFVLVISFAANLLPWQFDDAFINYRYAANFLEEGRLSFNHGGQNVEGMTGTLWFWLLVAGAAVLGVSHLPEVAVLLGIVILAGATGMAWRILKQAFGPWVALVTLVVMLSLPSVPFYAITGMDQILFSMLVMLVALYLAGCWNGKWITALLAFLAAWARPEAPIIGVMIAISLCFPGRRRMIADLMPAAIALVAGMASLVLYRVLVFGDVLPNTYYAKPSDIVFGWQYVSGSIANCDWLIFLLAIASVAAWLGDARHRLMYVFALVWLAVPVLEGGDWMPMYRFLLTAMLLLAMTLPGLLSARSRVIRWLLVASLVFLPYQGFAVIQFSQKILDFSYMSKGALLSSIQLWLDRNQVRSLAIMDIGRVSFGKPYEIIDLGGLTDQHIAHLPGKHMGKRVSVAYLQQRQVDAVFLRVRPDLMAHPEMPVSSGMIEPGTEQWLFEDPLFHENYVLLMAMREVGLQVDVPEQYLVYVRRGLAVTHSPLLVIERQGYKLVDYPAVWGAAAGR